MLKCLMLLVFTLIGSICTLKSHYIDTNRVRLLPKNLIQMQDHKLRTTNDDDDHVNWNLESRRPLHTSRQAYSVPFKVHQSKKDPRLFYQSDSYLREVEQKDLNRDVTYIYPGREMIRSNEINGSRMCIKCPLDMTLVAQPGSDKVVLQHPRLRTCSGRKAHRNTRFIQMYGPKFGSLVHEGSHMIIGQITNKGKIFNLCKMQVHVVIQGCVTPKYLKSHCDNQRRCNFTCRDPKLEVQGQTCLTCDSHMQWSAALPVCKARTWCDPPSPPDHGHMNCKSVSAGNTRMAEGSRCRLKCERGWHQSSRAFAVCRRGAWTHTLACITKQLN